MLPSAADFNKLLLLVRKRRIYRVRIKWLNNLPRSPAGDVNLKWSFIKLRLESCCLSNNEHLGAN